MRACVAGHVRHVQLERRCHDGPMELSTSSCARDEFVDYGHVRVSEWCEDKGESARDSQVVPAAPRAVFVLSCGSAR